MSTTCTWEADGRVARVLHDNAARGNAIDDASLAELVEALEAAAADPTCAVVRLEMAGRHFCGGWDTRSFGDLSAARVDAVAARLRASDETLGRIRALPVPVVAAVRGKVIGFGAGLLAAIHLPVVSLDAQLTLPEVRFGFAPAGVGHVIAQAVPRAHAYALLSGVRAASGADLDAWGLTARAVEEDELDTTVDQLVDQLATIPGDALRGVVEVVESSRATGRPDHAFLTSARSIVHGTTGGQP